MSGSFALQAVGKSPEKFSGVAAISPSLWAEPAAEISVQNALSANAEFFCHLSAGTAEVDRHLTGRGAHMFELVASLGKNLEDEFGERVSTRLFEGETHFGIPFAAICGALRILCR